MVDVVVDCFFEVDVQLKHFMEGVLTPYKKVYKNVQKKLKKIEYHLFLPFTVFCSFTLTTFRHEH